MHARVSTLLTLEQGFGRRECDESNTGRKHGRLEEFFDFPRPNIVQRVHVQHNGDVCVGAAGEFE